MISDRISNTLRALLLAALVPFFAADARGEGSGDLMRRHLDAIGGERAVRGLLTLVARGEIEIAGTGLRGTIESRSANPCLSSSEISLGFFTLREGFDGERIWIVDPNGNLQIRRDTGSIEYQRTMCAIDSREYIFGGDGVRVEPAGRDTADGVPCEAVALIVEGGAPCRLLFADSTHLVRRMEIMASEGNTVHTYDDYRPVDGVMFPFVQRMELPSLGQRVEIRYSEVTPNARIDPIFFVPPAASERTHRFASGRGSFAAAFEYRYRHIYVSARIEGLDEDLFFLVDSGAGMTVIDSALSSRLDLPSGGLLPGAGAGGLASFRLVRVPGLTLGDISLAEQTAVAFPLTGFMRQFDGIKIGGILGYDFLSRFTVRIDYENRRISFFDPDSITGSTGTAVEAPLMRNIFSVPVAIDGAGPGVFLLDTGAASSLIQKAFAVSAGVDSQQLALEISFRGAGGEERAALCRFDTLAIGGVVLPDPVLAVATGERGLAAIENVDGLVGNDVLERFAVTLDYRSQRVLLEPNGRFDEPFFRDRSGLQIARNESGRFVVMSVVPRSPAARAGLRPGDVITKIDRTRTERFRSLGDAIAVFEGAEGTTCRLEISRGREKRVFTLTLERYL